ncbi:pyrroline-5-carboxylate reductase [Metarhizobium album]|uniref:Pyrroline-5-carboxylate reductase n=1 Tax=Metarhizobium album TaxID=2182425 RepID=A0A2U2DGQ1_9HYPH|nr:pyrroline-5-carboxylate reductase [Rhizobium album]PWE52496.1 pyrroline-5-carboxylate reductase [Rhizobium album]
MDILLIGAGNMGFALLKRWTEFTQHRFSVVELTEALRDRARAHGAVVFAAYEDLPDNLRVDAVVLATKPQIAGDVARLYASFLKPGGFIVSIAAGVNVRTLQNYTGNAIAIVRCMPNTPVSTGLGVIACFLNDLVTPNQADSALLLLSSLGIVEIIADEALMDCFTAVAGSGPAYVFHFIEALAGAAEANGLSPDIALQVAKQTVLGAATIAAQSSTTPSELRMQVTSPNGTTAAGLAELMNTENGLSPLIHATVSAARKRSLEIDTELTKVISDQ